MQFHFLNKQWLISELKVVACLFAAVLVTAFLFFITDVSVLLQKVLNGDMTKETVISGLSILIIQSLIRGIVTQVAPKVFSHGTDTPSTIASAVNTTVDTIGTQNTSDVVPAQQAGE